MWVGSMDVCCVITIHFYVLFLICLYWFFRAREKERDGEIETSMRETSISYLLHIHYWGSSLQYKHMPWLGIHHRTSGFVCGHSASEPHQPGSACISGSYPTGIGFTVPGLGLSVGRWFSQSDNMLLMVGPQLGLRAINYPVSGLRE